MASSMDNSRKIMSHIDPGSLNYIIYHKDCPDGFGAAYSAWTRFGKNVTYFAAAHDTPPPPDTEIQGKRVGLFDFAYKNEILNEIEKKAELVVVIDHHVSAKERLTGQGSEKEKNYHFDMNKSGARLAWEFFWPDKEVPLLIRYIEDRDLWRFALPKSREFTTFWNNVPKEFEAYDQYIKDESLIDKAVEGGTHILRYTDALVNQLVEKHAAKRQITLSVDRSPPKTFTVFMLNSITLQSELGNVLARKEEADFGLVWYYDAEEKRFNVSLRSIDEKADVSKIAKVFGGGGHRNASGFTWEDETIEKLFDYEKTDSEIWYI
ncbi:14823_t:CDS:2 [Funneliformis geosporum]|uniref:13921_t:CDS:1 n=1 Tax=Funneliformis geosporum TaxID=1117311 RepID=A0A9W4WQJ9_9GLOM|nr:13921_t:CDS:2 [Funneliformis geosporum]CAI2180077.1 14823_t:CDS:2 [Funneliformis geosporum]